MIVRAVEKEHTSSYTGGGSVSTGPECEAAAAFGATDSLGLDEVLSRSQPARPPRGAEWDTIDSDRQRDDSFRIRVLETSLTVHMTFVGDFQNE